MNITTVELSKLIPFENNVRKHTDIQINELIKSVKEFGQTRPIVTDEGYNVLIGNGLLEAMKRGGYETADVLVIEGMSEKNKKKLILSDNRIFSLGLDDNSAIQKIIEEISVDGDFNVPGFDEDVLRSMVRSMDEVADDMQDYGKMSEEAVERAKEEQQPVAAPEVKREVHAPVEYREEKQVRKVICPSCGEVIYLD